MENQVVSWKTVLGISGSIIAFAIGSGFATGQEALQFYASYGFWGIAGASVFFILNLFFWSDFITIVSVNCSAHSYHMKKAI